MKNIISVKDFSKEFIEQILNDAERKEREQNSDFNVNPKLKDKVVATMFFEPSTRTKLSFQTAALRNEMKYIDFLTEVSSLTKGESFVDTIKVISGYADVLVIRHPKEGAAKLASVICNKPIINGGDGGNQHPTQTLLDLYTIKKGQGKLENLHIAMSGDLKYGRTVHSLAEALCFFNATLYFVAPDSLQMPKSVLEYLDKRDIKYSLHSRIEEVIDKVDVLYCTRIQKERFPDLQEYVKVKDVYVLKSELLKNVKPNLKIMHPLPRVNEITSDVDNTKYAQYFEQAHNGIPVRMAILEHVLSEGKD